MNRNDREHLAVWPPCATLPREMRDILAIEDEDEEWRQVLRAERRERLQGLMSVAKVAGILGVTKAQVYWLMRHSGLPRVKLASRWTMVPEREFNEWLKSRKT